jgi:hypothetical protein
METSIGSLLVKRKCRMHILFNHCQLMGLSSFLRQKNTREIDFYERSNCDPHVCRKPNLHHLHCGHVGVERTKSLAGLICWWNEINLDIQITAKSCERFQFTKSTSNSTWQRVILIIVFWWCLCLGRNRCFLQITFFAKKQTASFTISALRHRSCNYFILHLHFGICGTFPCYNHHIISISIQDHP